MPNIRFKLLGLVTGDRYPNWNPTKATCGIQSPKGYHCTEEPGHALPHISCDSSAILFCLPWGMDRSILYGLKRGDNHPFFYDLPPLKWCNLSVDGQLYVCSEPKGHEMPHFATADGIVCGPAWPRLASGSVPSSVIKKVYREFTEEEKFIIECRKKEVMASYAALGHVKIDFPPMLNSTSILGQEIRCAKCTLTASFRTERQSLGKLPIGGSALNFYCKK